MPKMRFQVPKSEIKMRFQVPESEITSILWWSLISFEVTIAASISWGSQISFEVSADTML